LGVTGVEEFEVGFEVIFHDFECKLGAAGLRSAD